MIKPALTPEEWRSAFQGAKEDGFACQMDILLSRDDTAAASTGDATAVNRESEREERERLARMLREIADESPELDRRQRGALVDAARILEELPPETP